MGRHGHGQARVGFQSQIKPSAPRFFDKWSFLESLDIPVLEMFQPHSIKSMFSSLDGGFFYFIVP